MTAAQAAKAAKSIQDMGREVVFTNGCFDLLHAGHVRCLEAARSKGEMLILGLNSDESVRKLNKGGDRPLVTQGLRAEAVAALAAVNAVVIFDEPDPLRLIETIAPDVLVKGGDWPEDRIVGADFVRGRGGRVFTFPLVEGLSTTALVAHIRAGLEKPWGG